MAEDLPEEPPEVVGEIFDALSSRNRRYLLYYLRDRETVTIGELATALAGWEQARESGTEVVTPDDRKRILVSLHHVDLPYLEDAGFIRYDLDSKTVTFEPMSEIVDSILDESLVYERRDNRNAGNDPDRRQSERK